jgi:hypothetical protein
MYTTESMALRGPFSCLALWAFLELSAVADERAASGAQKDPHPPFGVRKQLLGDEVCRLRDLLLTTTQPTACEPERPCPEGVKLIRLLFGNDVYNGDFPDLIAYLGADGTPRNPTIIWKGKATAHLFGARRVWLLVFSDHRTKSDPNKESESALFARHTVDQWASMLPSIGLFNLTSPELKAPEGPKSEAKQDTLKFTRIGSAPEESCRSGTGKTQMWYATTSFPVTTDTSNRISLYRAAPEDEKETPPAPCCTTRLGATAESPEAGTKPQDDPVREATPEDFLVVRGHFSNSRSGRIGASVALAATTSVKDTIVESSFGSYLLGKLYFIRPRMKAGQVDHVRGPYDSSLALAVGTRIGATAFREKVVGLSWAHYIDKFGFFAGVNLISGGVEERLVPDTGNQATNQKRNQPFKSALRPVFAFEYTF